MKILKILLVIPIAFAVLLAGCANSSPEEANLTPAGDKTGPESPATGVSPVQPEPEPGETPFLEPVEGGLEAGQVPPEILEEITADLIKQTGAARPDIQVVRAEAVVWNDGSLGCPKPGEVYIQILMNGYWIVVQVEGVEYDYRVSDSGHFKLCEGESMPPVTSPDMSDGTQNPLVIQAKEDLAKRLGVQISEIELLSYEEVTWPDSSLGCPQPGMKYLQVPSDGARIRLSAEGLVYDYHSGGNRGVFLCETAFKDLGKPTPIDLTQLTTPAPDNSIPPGEDQ
jgi:hypothetical protein